MKVLKNIQAKIYFIIDMKVPKLLLFHQGNKSNLRINLKDKLKDKLAHRSCVIHEGQCSCKLSYIGETKRNCEIR